LAEGWGASFAILDRIEDTLMCAQVQQDSVEDALEGSDHNMIEQVNIHNFRCFQQIEVVDLKPVNLIVGKNSSGKSAFQEAIFISSSSYAANTALQLRSIRKMGNQIINPVDAQAYRGLWEDLFFEFDHDKKISITVGGNPNADSRSLKIEYVAPVYSQELSFGKQTGQSVVNLQQATSIPQIEFKWKRRGHKEIISTPKVSSTGLQIDSTGSSFFNAIWYTPNGGETPEENTRRFSALDKRGDGTIDLILSAITKEFSFITGLSVQYHAGLPMMFATLENQARKMPVPLLSDGINRLLGICLSLAYYEGGTVLIDQFEDGFHYSLLPSIWKSVYMLAKKFRVQLFISTHSRECIEAIRPTIEGNEEDFCLLRTLRNEKSCEIKSFSGSYLETALEQDFEVR
jgi:hypothetical protein